MVFLRFLVVILVAFLFSGCTSQPEGFVHHKSQFEKYKNFNSHSISRTRSGTYIYKDNYSYNAVGYDPFFHMEQGSSSYDSGPGVIKFGP